jgi:hypothetical protein
VWQRIVATLALFLASAASGAAAERSWRIEAALGAAHSFDSPRSEAL